MLFCDVAGSTALAERLGADAMHGVLNAFFELALAEIHRYEGTINRKSSPFPVVGVGSARGGVTAIR